MKYYKHQPSSGPVSNQESPSYQEESEEEDGENHESVSDDAKFEDIKQELSDLPEGHDEDTLIYVWFDYDATTGIYRKTVHTKKPGADE